VFRAQASSGSAILVNRSIVKPSAHPFDPAPILRGLDSSAALRSGWLVLGLVVLATLAATLWLKRWSDRRARRRRAARAQRAERDAAGLLEARGFEVLGSQVRQSWSLMADSEELQFTLVADYVVERQGRRWVAEVKTGERALDLRHGPTRRQLLEYRQAFAVEGVLLVDAEGRSVQRVHFRDARAPGGARRLVAFGVGLISGLSLAGYWFSLHPGTFSP
jgi:hypothetical protein